ncbi:MAG: hypothetical protein SGI77_19205 [Pirellulaceae bacterium]|nr:hypothetical protein [Pirellulaceae bacterium]
MFGLGKSTTKAKTAKPKKSSRASLPLKQWALNHGEKVGMGIFLLLTGYLVYNGLSTQRYDSTKTPEGMASKTSEAQNKIENEDHSKIVLADRLVKTDFVKQVDDARKDMDPSPYVIVNIPVKPVRVSGEKRGDPELVAPVELQGHFFSGAIAIVSPTPAPADALLNAPPVGDGKRTRKPPTASTPPRMLDPFFDLGYQHNPAMMPQLPIAPSPIPGLSPRPVEAKAIPKKAYFSLITAAVPHETISESYRQAFASATDYIPNRDTPNYLSYEVQRVDVTDNPDREIGEADWKVAEGCSSERQLKEKSLWAGISSEVSAAKYVVENLLSMPIPPILISDYRPIASHPLIPRLDLVRATASGGDMSDADSSETPEPMADSDSEVDGLVAQSIEASELSLMPQALEPSDYKLLRFVDFDVTPGKKFRYRVRLALEDPNYTRARSISPRTADMKPEAVARVQAIEFADNDAIEKLPPGTKFDRNSKIYTPWSQPSLAISTESPVELYSSQVSGYWITTKRPKTNTEISFESVPVKASVVYAEWENNLALRVPRKLDVYRGTVLSGLVDGLDTIHPITKTIKWATGFSFRNPVTIVDVRGGLSLEAGKNRVRDRDPLPAGGEIVAYDPLTGNLVISREFDSISEYQMLGFSQE